MNSYLHSSNFSRLFYNLSCLYHIWPDSSIMTRGNGPWPALTSLTWQINISIQQAQLILQPAWHYCLCQQDQSYNQQAPPVPPVNCSPTNSRTTCVFGTSCWFYVRKNILQIHLGFFARYFLEHVSTSEGTPTSPTSSHIETKCLDNPQDSL